VLYQTISFRFNRGKEQELSPAAASVATSALKLLVLRLPMDGSSGRGAVLQEPSITVAPEPSEVAHVAAILILPKCATLSVLSLLSISTMCTGPAQFLTCLPTSATSRPRPSPPPHVISTHRCQPRKPKPWHTEQEHLLLPPNHHPPVPAAIGELFAGLLVILIAPHPSLAASCCASVPMRRNKSSSQLAHATKNLSLHFI
jgi:hypothetical protein